jgi:rubrerythrin
MTEVQKPQTMKNLESVVAVESVAYIKYLYFAKVAGETEMGKLFEEAANQARDNAFEHLGLLVGIPEANAMLVNGLEMESSEAEGLYKDFAETAAIELTPFTNALDKGDPNGQAQIEQFVQLYQEAVARFNRIAELKKSQSEKFKDFLVKFGENTQENG